MTQFVENQWFEIVHCCDCGMAFAMTTDFQRRRREDRKLFHCPAGHPQHYTGETEAARLKRDLERKQEMLEAAQARASRAEQEKQQAARAHRKMRQRVANGVCPCCNRTFQNLMAHMKSQHPEFASDPRKTFHAVREAFGMTQADVAREACVNTAYVSNYENGKSVPARATERLEGWLESQESKA